MTPATVDEWVRCPHCGGRFAPPNGYSEQHAATMIGVARGWISRECRLGRIAFIVDDGGRRRLLFPEIERLIAKRAAQTFLNLRKVTNPP